VFYLVAIDENKPNQIVQYLQPHFTSTVSGCLSTPSNFLSSNICFHIVFASQKFFLFCFSFTLSSRWLDKDKQELKSCISSSFKNERSKRTSKPLCVGVHFHFVPLSCKLSTPLDPLFGTKA
jgi:hypothetical protein